eukprot:SM000203S06157  [mRNA]  locus=s203:121739:125163:- [translate_table: standard]
MERDPFAELMQPAPEAKAAAAGAGGSADSDGGGKGLDLDDSVLPSYDFQPLHGGAAAKGIISEAGNKCLVYKQAQVSGQQMLQVQPYVPPQQQASQPPPPPPPPPPLQQHQQQQYGQPEQAGAYGQASTQSLSSPPVPYAQAPQQPLPQHVQSAMSEVPSYLPQGHPAAYAERLQLALQSGDRLPPPPLQQHLMPPMGMQSSYEVPLHRNSSLSGPSASSYQPYEAQASAPNSSPMQYRFAQPVASAPTTSTGISSYPRLQMAQPVGSPPPLAREANSGSAAQGGSAPLGTSRVPIDKVIEDVSAMGFSKDQVRTVVRRLTENGQAVDLNIVLDKLMNGGVGNDTQAPKGWFSR